MRQRRNSERERNKSEIERRIRVKERGGMKEMMNRMKERDI